MIKSWKGKSWTDYLEFHKKNKKIWEKINKLLENIDRNGYKCIGKPEPLKGDLSGWWSIRIDEKNRLIFKISNNTIEIWHCGSHYGDK